MTVIIIFCIFCLGAHSIQRDIQQFFGHKSLFRKALSFPSHFENKFYDQRMKTTLDPSWESQHQVLLAIDDETLKELSLWPIPRHYYVTALQKLQALGAKVVSFDVLFSENTKACSGENPDLDLAKSILDFNRGPGKVIVGYYLTDPDSPEAYEELPFELLNFALNEKQDGETTFQSQAVHKPTFPIQEILQAETPLGYITASPDLDGIFRHYNVLMNQDVSVPSISLLTYKLLTDDPLEVRIFSQGDGLLKTKMGDLPLSQKAETKIRWLGGANNFPVISFKDLIQLDLESQESQEMRQVINGKAVFIGSTAVAAHDLRHTPVDSNLPGVFFHMNMVEMLVNGYFFQDKIDSLWISLAILIVGVTIFSLISLLGNAIIDLTFVCLFCAITYYIDVYHLIPKGYELSLFFALFGTLASYVWTTFIHFYFTSQEKKQIKGTFSRYVAPDIVDEMLSHPDKLKVGGEKKNITIFFSDVRDFTSISEKLTPSELSDCLNQYMGKMTDIILDTKGTLDKYIGDAIVAYWGAPLDVDNHAYIGVKASLQQIETLPEVNKSFRQQNYPEFQIGIGMNTGDCSVGNMGSDRIFSYTALGDNMNLGARLESLCKYYGSQLSISEYTLEAIPEELRGEFTLRTLDKVRVKGRNEPVVIYEVLHSFHPFKESSSSLQRYHEGFELYQRQSFQDSLKIMQEIQTKHPKDKASLNILNYCQEFLRNPPPSDWDGVITMTSK